MLFKRLHLKLSGLSGLLLFQALCAKASYAATTVPNAADMIKNIAKTVPNLMLFVTALAYLMGFFFVIHGVMLLKKYSEQRSAMSAEAKLTGPLLNIFVGAALIYLPSSIQAGILTFWADPHPYAYDVKGGDEWDNLLSACFMIIQLIGVISFIRGLVILTHAGGHGGQQGSLGRAIAHIIAGILCVNIVDFINTIFTTLGLQPMTFG